ncbi:hypothetical protein AA14337_0779 [Acetobacter malorum DSM 14337]|uniref:Phage protein n=1 Tax=Acetobacter malorum DSM 14337 TaxID=1307910 RepID=A0ABQ0PPA7_9PROT|nr:hypothetical protein [Acetobacter malorum]KXV08712.1 hypothetical protein AD930_03635 [Acetobacter malorum]GBQ77304.1 hypothetical protein AA14337_0779 [Acetobacter malorum DSM 14337]
MADEITKPEYTPEELRPMNALERSRCQMVLGWNDPTLAGKLGVDRNKVYRNRPIEGEEAAWLRRLTAFHIANPPPASVQARHKAKLAQAGMQ